MSSYFGPSAHSWQSAELHHQAHLGSTVAGSSKLLPTNTSLGGYEPSLGGDVCNGYQSYHHQQAAYAMAANTAGNRYASPSSMGAANQFASSAGMGHHPMYHPSGDHISSYGNPAAAAAAAAAAGMMSPTQYMNHMNHSSAMANLMAANGPHTHHQLIHGQGEDASPSSAHLLGSTGATAGGGGGHESSRGSSAMSMDGLHPASHHHPHHPHHPHPHTQFSQNNAPSKMYNNGSSTGVTSESTTTSISPYLDSPPPKSPESATTTATNNTVGSGGGGGGSGGSGNGKSGGGDGQKGYFPWMKSYTGN